jgi:hypothetical protein
MSSQINNINDFSGEMLTLEEFAGRMNVCRTIVYDMISDNRLRAGRHYIVMNSKKRFPWGAMLIRTLLEDSVEFGTNKKCRIHSQSRKITMTAGSHVKIIKTKTKKLPFINLD